MKVVHVDLDVTMLVGGVEANLEIVSSVTFHTGFISFEAVEIDDVTSGGTPVLLTHDEMMTLRPMILEKARKEV